MYISDSSPLPGNMRSPSTYQAMSHLLLESVAGSAPVFFYIFNLSSEQLTYASPYAQQLFGSSPDLLLSNGIQPLEDICYDDDLQSTIEARAKFRDSVSSMKPDQRKKIRCTISYRITRKCGRVIAVQEQLVIMETDSQGSPLLMLGTICEVPAMKSSFEFASFISVLDQQKGWVRKLGDDDACMCNLSKRELEILKLLAKGKSSKIIAGELKISINTVNNHRKNMLLKASCNNIAELVNFAMSQGLI